MIKKYENIYIYKLKHKMSHKSILEILWDSEKTKVKWVNGIPFMKHKRTVNLSRNIITSKGSINGTIIGNPTHNHDQITLEMVKSNFHTLNT